jgi:hypothetical protein
MNYLQPLLFLVALFLLTALLCWIVENLLSANPFCGVGVLLFGSLGVIVALDVVGEMLFSRPIR